MPNRVTTGGDGVEFDSHNKTSHPVAWSEKSLIILLCGQLLMLSVKSLILFEAVGKLKDEFYEEEDNIEESLYCYVVPVRAALQNIR